MTHYTKTAGFPNVPLNADMVIRLRALSPTTDAVVSGVTCTQFAIYARDESGEEPGDTVPVYSLDSDADATRPGANV